MRNAVHFIILLCVSPLAASYYDSSLISSYQFVTQKSRIYKIDNSHNQVHSKEVLFWANQIIQPLIKTIPFSSSDIDIITQSCLLHDMIDHKYHDLTDQVVQHLKSSCAFSDTEIDIMIQIMKSISYSKTVSKDGIIFPPWVELSEYKTLYHIVREADLLSSYNIARMIEYRLAKFPSMTDYEIRNDVIRFYHHRMKQLVPHKIFHHKHSEDLAIHLDTISSLRLPLVKFIPLDGNLDILRIIHDIPIHYLIDIWHPIYAYTND